MKKKLLVILFVFFMIVPITKVSAQTEYINFLTPDKELLFETTYNSSEYYLDISKNDSEVVYNIFSRDGKWQESWTFEIEDKNSIEPLASTYVKRYTNAKDVGALSGKLHTEVAVELYDGGGIYKQFNKLVAKTYWVDGWSYFSVDRNASWMVVTPINPTNRDVWPSVGLEVEGTFIVTAQLDASVNSQFGLILKRGGFSIGSSYFYSKYIPVSYTIKLISW